MTFQLFFEEKGLDEVYTHLLKKLKLICVVHSNQSTQNRVKVSHLQKVGI